MGGFSEAMVCRVCRPDEQAKFDAIFTYGPFPACGAPGTRRLWLGLACTPHNYTCLTVGGSHHEVLHAAAGFSYRYCPCVPIMC